MTTKEKLQYACQLLRAERTDGDVEMLLRDVRSDLEDGAKIQCSGRDLWALIDEIIYAWTEDGAPRDEADTCQTLE